MVTLESPVPEALWEGRPSALFLTGTGRPAFPATRVRDRWWTTIVAPADLPGIPAIPVRPRPEPTPTDASLVVCMATYEPDPALLRAQVDSLRAQTDTDWVCFVSDDASSSPPDFGGDPRFVLSVSEQRRGFYANFERALAMVPDTVEMVALCDQDDVWHPDKLATLRAELGTRTLVFSDQRLTTPDGRVLGNTLWRGRAVNHDDLLSMIVANSVTGAAALFRRSLLDVLLPFPLTPGFAFHDHWLAMAALASGEVGYVARPLYDYVQHPGAVFGQLGGPEPAVSRRAGYFYGYVPRAVAARTLLARGVAHPVLDRFLAAERSPAALAWLARTPRRDTTLGTERALVEGVLWRWGARLARDVSMPDPLGLDQRALRRWRAEIASAA